MSDQPDDGIRRVGRKDRKKRIDTRRPLFPDDDRLPVDDVVETEAEAPEEAPPAPAEEFPRIATPPEERFPPLAPPHETPDKPHPAAPRRTRPKWLYNLIAVFFVLATLGAVAYFALLWVNPYHPLNPLPPYTPLPIVVSATPQPPTSTPVPTATEPPTATPTATVPAAVQASPVAQTSDFPYALDDLNTTYAGSASGCDWSGIAGSVLDDQAEGVADLTVRVAGEENDVLATGTTGSAPDFGPGGFEIQVGNSAQLAPYTIQLFGPDGVPLSEDYLVVTSDQCDQNVVVVTFVANPAP